MCVCEEGLNGGMPERMGPRRGGGACETKGGVEELWGLSGL